LSRLLRGLEQRLRRELRLWLRWRYVRQSWNARRKIQSLRTVQRLGGRGLLRYLRWLDPISSIQLLTFSHHGLII